MRRLDGKTALITGGGTQGIGRATAIRLAAEGAHVFIAGRRAPELAEAAELIGPAATPVPTDITNAADLDRLYDIVREHGKGLDILFANAAAASFGGTLADTTHKSFDQVFDVNVKGTLFTVQHALPLLNEGASVILNASTAGVTGVPGTGVYAASKAALRSFARTWASELSGRNIRVNVISPGPIQTSGMAEVVGSENMDAFRTQQESVVPIGRMGQPDEVASVVAFLASSDSSFMLGANVYVDGGLTQL